MSAGHLAENGRATYADALALSACEVARLLAISERHLWTLHSSGRLPRPVKLGRSVRWNRGELQRWLDAGCPSRDRWEQDKLCRN